MPILKPHLKLRIWELEDYQKLIYLDCDTIVTKEVDLFKFPELSGSYF